jgi:hypothetical protein
MLEPIPMPRTQADTRLSTGQRNEQASTLEGFSRTSVRAEDPDELSDLHKILKPPSIARPVHSTTSNYYPAVT